MYLAAALCALTPPGVTTVKVTLPLPAGAVAVIRVGPFTVNLAAGREPNLTVVDPVRPVPLSTTWLPPAAGPELGLIPVRTGIGTGGAIVKVLPALTPRLPALSDWLAWAVKVPYGSWVAGVTDHDPAFCVVVRVIAGLPLAAWPA